MRINAAWMVLTLGLGFVVIIGYKAFVQHPDPITAFCLFLLAVCGGGVFKVAYHGTTEKVAK
jgi:hypothetical protein